MAEVIYNGAMEAIKLLKIEANKFFPERKESSEIWDTYVKLSRTALNEAANCQDTIKILSEVGSLDESDAEKYGKLILDEWTHILGSFQKEPFYE